MRLPNSKSWLPFLVGMIIGTAPIYWFGDGFVLEIKILKSILFGIFFIFMFGFARDEAAKRGNYTFFPREFGPPHLSIIIIATIPGLVFYTEELSAALFLFNVLFAFLFTAASYQFGLYVNSVGRKLCLPYFYIGFFLLIPFAILVVLDYFFGWPGWTNPLGDYYEFWGGSVSLAYTGFGGSRTGWGSGVALLVPLIVAWLVVEFDGRLIPSFIALALMASIILPGGRGAALAAFVSLLVGMQIIIRAKLVYLFFATLVLAGLAYFVSENLELFRLGSTDLSDVNSVTTGRFDTVILGLDILANNLWVGVGKDNVDLTVSGAMAREIHNSFVHISAELGLAVGCIIFAVYVRVLLWGYRVTKADRFYLGPYLVLVCGFVLCFSEPNMVFGTMFNMLPLWFAFGLMLAGKRLVFMTPTSKIRHSLDSRSTIVPS